MTVFFHFSQIIFVKFISFFQTKICDLCLRYARDDLATKRHSYRNSRFHRHRNIDRMKQERHTVERERIAERSSSKKFVFHMFFRNGF